MQGAGFLQVIFDREERLTRLQKPDRALVSRLTRLVGGTFGEEYAPLVYVLFNFMGRNLDQLTAFIETQCRAHASKADVESQHVFDHLRRFLCVYGDVSAYVIENSGGYGGGSMSALGSRGETTTREGAHSLVSRMDEAALREFYRRISSAIRRVPRSKQEAERRAATALERVLCHPTLQTSMAASVDFFEILSQTFREDPNRHPWFWGDIRDSPYAPAFVDDLLSPEMPRSVLAETFVALNGGGSACERIPDEVAVRIIDPGKLLANPRTMHVADQIFARLQHPARKAEGWRDPVLHRSLEIALHRDDPRRLLDIPLSGGKYQDWTMRDLLMRACFDRFDDGRICEGEAPLSRALFPLVERERMHAPPHAHRNNFNSAGVGTVRSHFLEAATAALSLQRGIYRFPWAIGFAQRALDGYYRTGRNYEFFPFGSATTAFEWFILQQFPRLCEGDNIVMTDQEYDLLPRHFQERCGERGVRPVSLRHPTEERQRTNEELLAAFEGEMDARTLMILISSKTRFGDAPCSQPRGNRPNIFYLQRLIASLKERHPTTIIALDGAQSIGRALPERQLLGADVFLGSGAKALGTGEAGFIALRNELAASVGYQPSMLPLDHIVAMGMALNNHDCRQCDLRRMEGDFGEQGQHEGWFNVARRMRHLTANALQKAGGHGANVLRLLRASGAQVLDDRLREAGKRLGGEKGLLRLFGCDVLSPYHCNALDHVGILTLLFPNMKGEQMASELSRRFHDMQVLPCRHQKRALRISFDYCHLEDDVSRLFEAMAITQSHIAAQDVQEGKPWREVYDLFDP